jgi:hypothetical protein
LHEGARTGTTCCADLSTLHGIIGERCEISHELGGVDARQRYRRTSARHPDRHLCRRRGREEAEEDEGSPRHGTVFDGKDRSPPEMHPCRTMNVIMATD